RQRAARRGTSRIRRRRAPGGDRASAAGVQPTLLRAPRGAGPRQLLHRAVRGESRAAVAPRADASPPRRTASGCAFGGGERRPRRLPALLRQSHRTPAPAAFGRAAERGGNAAPATRTLRAG